jgi:hypothetical protein
VYASFRKASNQISFQWQQTISIEILDLLSKTVVSFGSTLSNKRLFRFPQLRLQRLMTTDAPPQIGSDASTNLQDAAPTEVAASKKVTNALAAPSQHFACRRPANGTEESLDETQFDAGLRSQALPGAQQQNDQNQINQRMLDLLSELSAAVKRPLPPPTKKDGRLLQLSAALTMTMTMTKKIMTRSNLMRCCRKAKLTSSWRPFERQQ